jgi:hypothetical protein
MTEVGSRVVVESEKVGIPPRSGVVVGVEGTMLRVHWDDGAESSFVPAWGSIRTIEDKGPESRA